MMDFLPMKTLVVSHVTLVMSYLVVTLGPVRVMGAGAVRKPTVEEVGHFFYACICMQVLEDKLNLYTVHAAYQDSQ